MAERRFPYSLSPVRHSFPRESVDNAVRSLGSFGAAVPARADSDWVPPDVLAAVTLLLLGGQPRPERAGDAERASAVAGGVWVREQFTVHRPVRIGEALEIRGQIARRYSRKGRQYSVTTSQTRNAEGELVVSSCTTGLLRYRPDPGLEDSEDGLPDDEVCRPGPDSSAAGENPALAALRALRVGEAIRGPEQRVTLAMMRERDGGRSRNPIHTEPEEARRAGLTAPIAAGAHVLAFALEAMMRELGAEALIYGAHFDVRWVAPVHAEKTVDPRATVSAASADLVELELEVACAGREAMVGTVAVPLAAAQSA